MACPSELLEGEVVMHAAGDVVVFAILLVVELSVVL
jgi:hypothetical protein